MRENADDKQYFAIVMLLFEDKIYLHHVTFCFVV